VRLTARTSLAQKAANASMALVTCSASSRVGTRMRVDVVWVEDVWWGQSQFLRNVRGKLTCFLRRIRCSIGSK
jgi:hypothetical protein